MTIRWITPTLGTAPAAEMGQAPADVCVVDVRDLVDKAGNHAEAVSEKITAGRKLLLQGNKVAVCCDYGISRSSAIAAGILAVTESISLEAAVRRVQEATGETEIKLEPLQAVRAAIGKPPDLARTSTDESILITGTSGFLGKATAARLSRTMRVVAPLHAVLDVARGSTQLDVLAGEDNVRTIIHLANPRVYTSNVAMGTSIAMLRNVIDVCVARDIRLVYLSSWEVFSGYRGTLRADESLPALPRGPYAETKYLCEVLIEHARQHLGLRCALIRSSPVYGPGSDRPRFIYNFMDKAARNESIVTHHYRNGDPALDLLYRDDVVSLILRVAESGFIGCVNAGTGMLTSTYTIAEMLVDRLCSSSRVTRAEIDSDTARIALDCNFAQRVLGWAPVVTLEEGLAALAAPLTAERREFH